MENLRQLYADYLAEADKIRKEASVFAGLFGFGDDPRKHPCHMIFYQNVEKWVKEFVGSESAREQALEAATFMLEEPRKHMGEEGYWFLYVCVGFIRDMIPFLTPQECTELARRMNTLYPRRERMPLQQETFKLLQKAGK